MTQKIKIEAYPKAGTPDHSHLDPVVNYLIHNGNKSVNQYIWGNNRTGYFCHLENDIDFNSLRKVFDFPESIKISEAKQTIDCFNTYTVIKKS
ncbi:MAG: hypothetical protein CL693_08310 [Cellvibrionaceae bacterium]|nr:hypothetical protein [Cellvibrionaceae bacterium]|tara:strand:- start:53530 stop:53808 length:279 start_codon:yes stop_codon:yes gene_type:complete